MCYSVDEDKQNKQNKQMTAKTFEQTLNFVIANGADIEEKLSGLGTVFQTPEEMAVSDRHFATQAKKSEKIADNKNKNLKKCVVKGETRYYASKNLFKSVRGNWFEVRKDGNEYAIPKSKYSEMGLK